jgi:glucose/arabinose dehydrogenase
MRRIWIGIFGLAGLAIAAAIVAVALIWLMPSEPPAGRPAPDPTPPVAAPVAGSLDAGQAAPQPSQSPQPPQSSQPDASLPDAEQQGQAPTPAGEQAAARLGLQVPDGFKLSVYAEGLNAPRLMLTTRSGDLLVTLPRSGEVVRLLPDRDGDGVSDGREVVVDGLASVHGLELIGEWLYLAQDRRVTRLRYDAASGRADGTPELVLDGLPDPGRHWTRTLKQGPDGMLYLTAGSSCNVCIEEHPWSAAMIRFAPDLRGEREQVELYAMGLRNTVGFDWQPDTNRLFGVDNGRDMLGDDFPPDELNELTAGGFYGFPFFNGDNRPDPDLGQNADQVPLTPVAPVYGFQAHVAPLSIRFLQAQEDPRLAGTALVAQHGSWNRSSKVGYRVVTLRWGESGIVEEPFMTGFLQDGEVIGRPVDVIEASDGTIFVSDDNRGAIYRIAPKRDG